MANVIKFTTRDIKSVASLRGQIVASKRKQLEQTLRLANYALKAKIWWKSPEFKEANKGANVEELIRDVFGCGKSYFYKLCRAAEALGEDAQVLDRYNALCDAVDAEGDKPTERSLADFLAFLKDEEHHKSVPEDTEDDSVSEDTEDDSVFEDTDDVLFTFSAKGVSVRVYADGRVVKDGDDVEGAVASFLAAIGGE